MESLINNEPQREIEALFSVNRIGTRLRLRKFLWLIYGSHHTKNTSGVAYEGRWLGTVVYTQIGPKERRSNRTIFLKIGLIGQFF